MCTHQIDKTIIYTWESSCNCAIDVPHLDEDGLESEQLIFHFHMSRNSLDCRGLHLYNYRSIHLLGDGHNSF